MRERTVVAYRDSELRYPEAAPFHPERLFPEYPYGGEHLGDDNRVYGTVREMLHMAGLDASHFDTADWNPLGDLVSPGETILIKPNWVRDYHLRGETIFSLITHSSVLRPLIDYAYIAVGPRGRIWVMDAPQFDSDYGKIRKICAIDTLEQFMQRQRVPLTVADLRSLIVTVDKGVVVDRQCRECWECESVEFDLGGDSEFVALRGTNKNIFGSDYDRRITCRYHNDSAETPHHRYRISKRVLEADLVISVPKLKTHKKNGVTLNIKNMIGINTDKNYIPHYRVGAPSDGGDEFPDTRSRIKRLKRKLVRIAVDSILGKSGGLGEKIVYLFMSAWLLLHRRRLERKAGHKLDPIDVFYRTMQGDRYRTGNWYGNDTCWRAALDINKILRYGDLEGRMRPKPMRRCLSMVDGIVAGDGDGPMAATPRDEGVLLFGFDPLSVDRVATQIMGFEPELIRDIKRGEQLEKYALADRNAPLRVVSNDSLWRGGVRRGADLGFRPHHAWRDYLGGGR